MDKHITVSKLLNFCLKQMAKWNWDKIIFISSDDEWNEFHELLFSFTDNQKEIKSALDCSNTNMYDIEKYGLENIILLG